MFSVEEHEEGRVIMSKETWTLTENGSSLRRLREISEVGEEGARRQTLIYLRQSADRQTDS